MTKLRMISSLATAGVLLFAGCGKHEENEAESAPPPEATEGAEQAQPAAEEPMAPEEAAPAEGGEMQEGGKATQPKAPWESGAKSMAQLNDPEIAKITDVVNSGEIQQARLAQSQAANPNVQQFAAMMIQDHTQAKQNGAKLVVEQKLVPEESALATKLADGAQETLQSLQTGDTASFDRRYMEAQVKQHQEVLDLLDKQLIPSAQNPQLKAELEKTRGVVQRHLGEAKQIEASLSR